MSKIIDNINGEFVAEIIMNIVLFSIFIIVFFFTYAVHVEKLIIKDNVSFIVDDLTSNVNLLSKSQTDEIKKMLKNIPQASLEKDELVKENNKKLFTKVMIICSIFVTIGISLLGALFYFCKDKMCKFNIAEVATKSLIAVFFIALTEFIFVTFFVRKYISANPNDIKKAAVKEIKKLAN
jgi:hypothetical protein